MQETNTTTKPTMPQQPVARVETVDIFTFDESVEEKTGKRKHDYMLNGKPLTGVTTILKVVGKGDVLVQWSANQTCEYVREHVDDMALKPLLENAKYAWKNSRDTAGNFGTNVHKAIEEWIKNGNLPVDTDVKEYQAFENFREWAKVESVIFLESEKRVYSKKYWYAGTLDILVEIDGKIWLADIKTSSGIYPEHMWQMAGYDIALNEMTDNQYEDIEGYVVINIKKDGTMDWKKSHDRVGNKEAFLACNTIYRKKQELEGALGKNVQKANRKAKIKQTK